MARDEFERNKNVKDIVSFTHEVFANGRVAVVGERRGVVTLPSSSGAVKPGIGLIENEANDEGTVTDQIPHINGEITVGCYGAIY